MIPYSRPKLSDIYIYTIPQSKLLENHTLHSGTYLYSSYMPVPPPPSPQVKWCMEIRASGFGQTTDKLCSFKNEKSMLVKLTNGMLLLLAVYAPIGWSSIPGTAPQ